MPKTNPASYETPPQDGFAALEARVEEVQSLSEADREVAHAGLTPTALSEGPSDTFKSRDEAGWAAIDTSGVSVFGPALGLVQAVQACAEAALKFQIESLESFATIRGPQDVVATNMVLAGRAFDLHLGNMSRLSHAMVGRQT